LVMVYSERCGARFSACINCSGRGLSSLNICFRGPSSSIPEPFFQISSGAILERNAVRARSPVEAGRARVFTQRCPTLRKPPCPSLQPCARTTSSLGHPSPCVVACMMVDTTAIARVGESGLWERLLSHNPISVDCDCAMLSVLAHTLHTMGSSGMLGRSTEVTSSTHRSDVCRRAAMTGGVQNTNMLEPKHAVHGA